MNAQCNSCGGFNDINKCSTCFTLVCARCSTNHEQGCGQAAEMKRKGQGPTIHQSNVAEVARPNPVASIDEKVVMDGPAWYEPVVPAVEPTVHAVDTATGLPIFDAPFHFEVTAAPQEPSIEIPIPILETVDGVPVVYAVGSTPASEFPKNAYSEASAELVRSVMTDLTGVFDNTVGTAVGVSPEVIPETTKVLADSLAAQGYIPDVAAVKEFLSAPETEPVVADAPVAFVPSSVQADGSISGSVKPLAATPAVEPIA